MKEPVIDTTPAELLAEVGRKKAAGCRLVTLTAAPDGQDALDLLYHFDLDLRLSHLRLRLARGATIPSISGLYFAAFLVENEIQDLFGLRFDGLVLDYDRTLLLEQGSRDLSSPFFRAAVVKKTGPAPGKEGPGEAISQNGASAPGEAAPAAKPANAAPTPKEG